MPLDLISSSLRGLLLIPDQIRHLVHVMAIHATVFGSIFNMVKNSCKAREPAGVSEAHVGARP